MRRSSQSPDETSEIYGFLLIYRNNGETGPIYDLSEGTITIGASVEADIRLKIKDDRLEDIHCSLQVKENGIAIITNKSIAVPVVVNGEPLELTKQRILKHEDYFEVLGKKFQYFNDYISAVDYQINHTASRKSVAVLQTKTIRGRLTDHIGPKKCPERRSSTIGSKSTSKLVVSKALIKMPKPAQRLSLNLVPEVLVGSKRRSVPKKSCGCCINLIDFNSPRKSILKKPPVRNSKSSSEINTSSKQNNSIGRNMEEDFDKILSGQESTGKQTSRRFSRSMASSSAKRTSSSDNNTNDSVLSLDNSTPETTETYSKNIDGPSAKRRTLSVGNTPKISRRYSGSINKSAEKRRTSSVSHLPEENTSTLETSTSSIIIEDYICLDTKAPDISKQFPRNIKRGKMKRSSSVSDLQENNDLTSERVSSIDNFQKHEVSTLSLKEKTPETSQRSSRSINESLAKQRTSLVDNFHRENEMMMAVEKKSPNTSQRLNKSSTTKRIFSVGNTNVSNSPLDESTPATRPRYSRNLDIPSAEKRTSSVAKTENCLVTKTPETSRRPSKSAEKASIDSLREHDDSKMSMKENTPKIYPRSSRIRDKSLPKQRISSIDDTKTPKNSEGFSKSTRSSENTITPVDDTDDPTLSLETKTPETSRFSRNKERSSEKISNVPEENDSSPDTSQIRTRNTRRASLIGNLQETNNLMLSLRDETCTTNSRQSTSKRSVGKFSTARISPVGETNDSTLPLDESTPVTFSKYSRNIDISASGKRALSLVQTEKENISILSLDAKTPETGRSRRFSRKLEISLSNKSLPSVDKLLEENDLPPASGLNNYNFSEKRRNSSVGNHREEYNTMKTSVQKTKSNIKSSRRTLSSTEDLQTKRSSIGRKPSRRILHSIGDFRYHEDESLIESSGGDLKNRSIKATSSGADKSSVTRSSREKSRSKKCDNNSSNEVCESDVESGNGNSKNNSFLLLFSEDDDMDQESNGRSTRRSASSVDESEEDLEKDLEKEDQKIVHTAVRRSSVRSASRRNLSSSNGYESVEELSEIDVQNQSDQPISSTSRRSSGRKAHSVGESGDNLTNEAIKSYAESVQRKSSISRYSSIIEVSDDDLVLFLDESKDDVEIVQGTARRSSVRPSSTRRVSGVVTDQDQSFPKVHRESSSSTPPSDDDLESLEDDLDIEDQIPVEAAARRPSNVRSLDNFGDDVKNVQETARRSSVRPSLTRKSTGFVTGRDQSFPKAHRESSSNTPHSNDDVQSLEDDLDIEDQIPVEAAARRPSNVRSLDNFGDNVKNVQETARRSSLRPSPTRKSTGFVTGRDQSFPKAHRESSSNTAHSDDDVESLEDDLDIEDQIPVEAAARRPSNVRSLDNFGDDVKNVQETARRSSLRPSSTRKSTGFVTGRDQSFPKAHRESSSNTPHSNDDVQSLEDDLDIEDQIPVEAAARRPSNVRSLDNFGDNVKNVQETARRSSLRPSPTRKSTGFVTGRDQSFPKAHRESSSNTAHSDDDVESLEDDLDIEDQIPVEAAARRPSNVRSLDNFGDDVKNVQETARRSSLRPSSTRKSTGFVTGRDQSFPKAHRESSSNTPHSDDDVESLEDDLDIEDQIPVEAAARRPSNVRSLDNFGDDVKNVQETARRSSVRPSSTRKSTGFVTGRDQSFPKAHRESSSNTPHSNDDVQSLEDDLDIGDQIPVEAAARRPSNVRSLDNFGDDVKNVQETARRSSLRPSSTRKSTGFVTGRDQSFPKAHRESSSNTPHSDDDVESLEDDLDIEDQIPVEAAARRPSNVRSLDNFGDDVKNVQETARRSSVRPSSTRKSTGFVTGRDQSFPKAHRESSSNTPHSNDDVQSLEDDLDIEDQIPVETAARRPSNVRSLDNFGDDVKNVQETARRSSLRPSSTRESTGFVTGRDQSFPKAHREFSSSTRHSDDDVENLEDDLDIGDQIPVEAAARRPSNVRSLDNFGDDLKNVQKTARRSSVRPSSTRKSTGFVTGRDQSVPKADTRSSSSTPRSNDGLKSNDESFGGDLEIEDQIPVEAAARRSSNVRSLDNFGYDVKNVQETAKRTSVRPSSTRKSTGFVTGRDQSFPKAHGRSSSSTPHSNDDLKSNDESSGGNLEIEDQIPVEAAARRYFSRRNVSLSAVKYNGSDHFKVVNRMTNESLGTLSQIDVDDESSRSTRSASKKAPESRSPRRKTSSIDELKDHLGDEVFESSIEGGNRTLSSKRGSLKGNSSSVELFDGEMENGLDKKRTRRSNYDSSFEKNDLTTPDSRSKKRRSNDQKYRPKIEDVTPTTPDGKMDADAGFKTPLNTPGLFQEMKKSMLKSRSKMLKSSENLMEEFNKERGLKRLRDSIEVPRNSIKKMRLIINEDDTFEEYQFDSSQSMDSFQTDDALEENIIQTIEQTPTATIQSSKPETSFSLTNNDVAEVKKPKAAKSPKNDLTNIVTFKKMFATPRVAKSPKNDLRNVPNLRKIMSPKSQNSPVNDLTDVRGLKRLMKTPKTKAAPLNDSSDAEGLAEMFEISGVQRLSDKSDIENNDELFDKLFGKPPVKQYRGKSASPREKGAGAGGGDRRRTTGDRDQSMPSPRVQDWVEEQKIIGLERAKRMSDKIVTLRTNNLEDTPAKIDSPLALTRGRRNVKRVVYSPMPVNTRSRQRKTSKTSELNQSSTSDAKKNMGKNKEEVIKKEVDVEKKVNRRGRRNAKIEEDNVDDAEKEEGKKLRGKSKMDENEHKQDEAPVEKTTRSKDTKKNRGENNEEVTKIEVVVEKRVNRRGRRNVKIEEDNENNAGKEDGKKLESESKMDENEHKLDEEKTIGTKVTKKNKKEANEKEVDVEQKVNRRGRRNVKIEEENENNAGKEEGKKLDSKSKMDDNVLKQDEVPVEKTTRTKDTKKIKKEVNEKEVDVDQKVNRRGRRNVKIEEENENNAGKEEGKKLRSKVLISKMDENKQIDAIPVVEITRSKGTKRNKVEIKEEVNEKEVDVEKKGNRRGRRNVKLEEKNENDADQEEGKKLRSKPLKSKMDEIKKIDVSPVEETTQSKGTKKNRGKKAEEVTKVEEDTPKRVNRRGRRNAKIEEEIENVAGQEEGRKLRSRTKNN